MKTVVTAFGEKKIEDWDAALISIQLRQILQEVRAGLIDKLLADSLQKYISTTLSFTADASALLEIKGRLLSLRNAGIDMENYRSVLNAVLEKECTYIDTAFAYAEIDHVIKLSMQPALYKHMSTYSFDDIDLIQSVRRGLIAKILTEPGIKDYVHSTYNARLNDHAKLHYLLDELRNYFYNTPIDYAKMLDKFKRQKYEKISDACQEIFELEVDAILEKHFVHS
ncbi:hypothetical protein [Pseudochryseolinea flava]|uniref:Uncharacterized protein n=1 Tax=Pseudochryseolinea flava TaxID=2059302 RepID=A0A364XZ43_9BACT|nr:hypothetical protein [Pseudochryseolinea flava]RAV98876.1 hypothetical protein DQQ10_21480 [Pseudochryseolinea flava]